jgi:hypothetical protein
MLGSEVPPCCTTIFGGGQFLGAGGSAAWGEVVDEAGLEVAPVPEAEAALHPSLPFFLFCGRFEGATAEDVFNGFAE